MIRYLDRAKLSEFTEEEKLIMENEKLKKMLKQLQYDFNMAVGILDKMNNYTHYCEKCKECLNA
jgi:hypothetical protein